MKIDLKIGHLHAYPNSDLQFENLDFRSHDMKERYKRKLRDSKANGSDSISIDNMSFAQSFLSGGRSMGMSSAAMSVKTPNTHGSKSLYSK